MLAMSGTGDISPELSCSTIQEELRKLGIPEDVLFPFEEQGITKDIFLDLAREDMHDLFSNASTLEILKIRSFQNKMAKKAAKESMEETKKAAKESMEEAKKAAKVLIEGAMKNISVIVPTMDGGLIYKISFHNSQSLIENLSVIYCNGVKIDDNMVLREYKDLVSGGTYIGAGPSILTAEKLAVQLANATRSKVEFAINRELVRHLQMELKYVGSDVIMKSDKGIEKGDIDTLFTSFDENLHVLVERKSSVDPDEVWDQMKKTLAAYQEGLGADVQKIKIIQVLYSTAISTSASTFLRGKGYFVITDGFELLPPV